MTREFLYFIFIIFIFFKGNYLFKNIFLFCNNYLDILLFIYYGEETIVDKLDVLDKPSEENSKNQQIENKIKNYEEKFLIEIRNMNKNFEFNEQELKLKQLKFNEFFENIKMEVNKNLNDLNIEKKCQLEAEEAAFTFIRKEHLQKIKHCFVMESSPLGNILMTYDIERETFKYYSDNNIPYRYLEVSARKFVKQFNCRPIYIEMEEEIKNAEEKWEKDKIAKEEKEIEENKKKEEAKKNNIPIIETKNVFAKFKSYNRESGTGHVSLAAPPKNSLPNKSNIKKQENEKIILKDNANRYTYEGKLANFSFLQKIDKKMFDNKLGMSFSDFKKIHQNKVN